MALAIDGSTPAVATNAVSTVATVTTASFTPPAGALLLILWAGDTQLGVNPSTPTITDNLGSHLTYTQVDWRLLTDSPLGVDGQAAIWSAVVGSSAAMTVTVTSGTASGARESAMRVVVITGQHTTPIGAHGKSGSKSAASIAQSFTGTASGSWGFIAVCDWDTIGAETAGTGCTVVSSANIGSAISYGFLRRTSADGANGGTTTLNVTIPGTSTNLAWCYVEVVPATAAAAVFPAGQLTARRRPPPRRPRSAPTPVPAQVATAAAPVKVPDLRRRVMRAVVQRRSRPAQALPGQDLPAAAPKPRRVLGIRRRPGSVTPVPVQAAAPSPPAYPLWVSRARRVFTGRRRPGAPAPVLDQLVAPAPARPHRPPTVRRRPSIQVAPPDQAAAPPLSRPRRACLVKRRPAVPTPVPVQIAAAPQPVNPGWWLRSRRVITGRPHRGAPTPVPAQVAAPPPPVLPLWAFRPRRVVTGLRRGRQVMPVPTQAAAPPPPPAMVPQLRTARRVLLVVRRRPLPVPVPVVDSPPQALGRRRVFAPVRRRPTLTPVPVQPPAVPPVYPRQPVRRRIVALLLRRPGRLRFPEQPGAPVPTTTRGSASILGQSGSSSGSVSRATGTAQTTARDTSTAHIEEV